MQITIGKVNYDLTFGVAFVREVDKELGVKRDGVSFGLGLTIALPGLQSYDPSVLSDILHCATVTGKKRPSRADVDGYLDDPETDVETLFVEVLREIQGANATKAALKNMRA